jgi:hypothetical protein
MAAWHLSAHAVGGQCWPQLATGSFKTIGSREGMRIINERYMDTCHLLNSLSRANSWCFYAMSLDRQVQDLIFWVIAAMHVPATQQTAKHYLM